MSQVPSVGLWPNRLLVSLLLSMAVCLPAVGDGPSLFLPAGTTMQVRVTTALDSAKNQSGDRFVSVLERDVERDGVMLIPRGSTVQGVLRSVTPSGRIRGRAAMMLELSSVEVNGRTFSIESEPEIRMGPRHRGHNSKYAGAGLAAGMIVGGIATGGAGFVVLGAMAGGAAGLGAAAVNGREDVHIPAETVMIFRIRENGPSKALATRPVIKL